MAAIRRAAGRGPGGGKGAKGKKGKSFRAGGGPKKHGKSAAGSAAGEKKLGVKKRGKKPGSAFSADRKKGKGKPGPTAKKGPEGGRGKTKENVHRKANGDELRAWDEKQNAGGKQCDRRKMHAEGKPFASKGKVGTLAEGGKTLGETRKERGDKNAPLKKKKKSFEEQLQEFLDEQEGRTKKRTRETEQGDASVPEEERPAPSAPDSKAAEGHEGSAGEGSTQLGSLSVSKKRKLMNEMKLSHRNEDAGYIKQCFRLYGQLLAARPEQQNADTPEVAQRVKALFDFVLPRVKAGDRHLCTSRALQALLKLGSKTQRQQLWAILKENFAELCMGRTSCQVAMKLYLYGEKETQEEISRLISGNKDIFFSKCGARVWEYVYTATKSAKGQQHLLNAVMLPPLAIVRHPDFQAAPNFPSLFEKFNAETRKLTLEHISSVLQKCVDKELLDKAPVHRILKFFTQLADEAQLTATLQMTLEGFLRLASTKDGVEAMVRLLGYATAKQRKIIVKEMKKVVVSMTTNAVDYLLVLRIFCTVDDTKLVRDSLIKEMTKDIGGIAFDAQGYLVLLQLLDTSSDGSKYLPPHGRQMLQLPSPTSLKPLDARLRELRDPIVEALTREVVESAEKPDTPTASPDKCRKPAAGKRGAPEDLASAQAEADGADAGDSAAEKTSSSFQDWLENPHASRVFLELLKITKCPKILQALLGALGKDEAQLRGLVDHPRTQRLLCNLVKHADETWKMAEDGEDANSSFVEALWRVLEPHVAMVLASRGVFVATDVLQAARRLNDQKLAEQMVRVLGGDALKQARQNAQTQGLSTAGLDVLSSKLTEC
ncbi:hypothetical protein BESB_075300 [Besnoitia besnoiti]|uniref:CPL domain-containing protein n=1 Tax=Besnoitia besnoiti TaxID=94643 RepID=A0A2A9M7C8_BESBE|nr:uncharacterized protein BESB_075300 [Besnoitia besnoiti]PFH34378.1 hypothetical protein BESB_075300 [Besnoitia besnoiti]